MSKRMLVYLSAAGLIVIFGTILIVVSRDDRALPARVEAAFLSAPTPSSVARDAQNAPTERASPAQTSAGKRPPTRSAAQWSCDFELDYCGFEEQSKVKSLGKRRSSFTPIARSGAHGIKLTTLPGDRDVNGSGAWERNDLQLPASPEYCNAGQEEWWAFSVYFPDDYVMPREGNTVVNFHHNASGGLANFHFNSQPTGLRFHGFYGDVKNATEYRAELGRLRRNVWYDIVLHVRWSEGNDGLLEAWMNGKKWLAHFGPTLYPGIPCYLKLANYHDAVGKPSSIIFDRVMRGTSPEAVALTPLE